MLVSLVAVVVGAAIVFDESGVSARPNPLKSTVLALSTATLLTTSSLYFHNPFTVDSDLMKSHFWFICFKSVAAMSGALMLAITRH